MTMPEMNGADLAQQLLSVKPLIPIIICTGFSDLINETKAKSIGIKAFVNKPILKRKLAETVRNALKGVSSV